MAIRALPRACLRNHQRRTLSTLGRRAGCRDPCYFSTIVRISGGGSCTPRRGTTLGFTDERRCYTGASQVIDRMNATLRLPIEAIVIILLAW